MSSPITNSPITSSPLTSRNSPITNRNRYSLLLPERTAIRNSRVSLDGDSPRTFSSLKSRGSLNKSICSTPQSISTDSSPNRCSTASSFLLPSLDDRLKVSIEKITRLVSPEHDKENNLDVRNSVLSKISHLDVKNSVVVKKIYEGPKIFLKEKVKAQIILFEHIKPLSLEPFSSCIEIVSYIHGFETVHVPRIYVSASKIFPRLNNKLIVQGSNYAQESITSYIFSRISISMEGNDTKQTFGINLKYKKDSLANDPEFDEGVEFKGEKFLGPLPFIDHIKGSPEKSPVQLIWDEKLSLFLDDRAKCSTATTQAQRKSLTVLNQFPKSFLEDQAGVSVPRKRWCKSIRKVLVQICVSTMKAKLDSIDTVDEIIPLQISPKISIRDKYCKSIPADLPSSDDETIRGLKSNSGSGKSGKFSTRSD